MESFQTKTSRGTFAVYHKDLTKNPKILCVHGGPGMSSSYLHSLQETLGHKFDLIFFDQKGDGNSDCKAEELNSSLEGYSQDLISVSKEIKNNFSETLGVLGHSFGGFVTMLALSQEGHPFDFGVLTNTASDLSWAAEAEKNIQKMNIPKEATELEEKIFAGNGTDEDYKNMTVLYTPLYITEVPLDEAKTFIGSVDYRVTTYHNALHNLYAGMDLNDNCRKISAPCLVLGGSKDFVTPLMCQEKIASLISNSHFYCIDGVGHFPWFKKSKEFSDVITTWAKDLF